MKIRPMSLKLESPFQPYIMITTQRHRHIRQKRKKKQLTSTITRGIWDFVNQTAVTSKHIMHTWGSSDLFHKQNPKFRYPNSNFSLAQLSYQILLKLEFCQTGKGIIPPRYINSSSEKIITLLNFISKANILFFSKLCNFCVIVYSACDGEFRWQPKSSSLLIALSQKNYYIILFYFLPVSKYRLCLLTLLPKVSLTVSYKVCNILKEKCMCRKK